MEALFRSIVADLDAVYIAYDSVGLLAEAAPGSAAWTLLDGGENADQFRREVLLVDALVRHRVVRLVLQRYGPRHIVVFGGNNVGKSTVINVLNAGAIASTSPEGGHTRHAQAFAETSEPLFAWNPYAFCRFRRVAPDQLPDEGFDCYAVIRRTTGVLPENVVLWDVPDCDAVGSARYAPAVAEAVAAADLLIYVTSVEKYTVADLVEWIFHIADAGIPILECLNKTPRKDRALVIRKQVDDILPTVSKRLGLAVPLLRMVALRYMTDGEEADLWGSEHPEAAELREAALSGLAGQDENEQAQAALRSVSRRIERVLEPARTELSVRSAWRALAQAAVAEFVRSYENHYLTGDSVIDPFKQLNAKLLQLLNPDIPYLGPAITGLRAVQRIPNRLLMSVARGLYAFLAGDEADSRLTPELRAYTTAHQAVLITLKKEIDAKVRTPRHHPFWDQLADQWDLEIERLAEKFDQAAARYLDQTDAEIESAARDILQALQQRPNLLALLKAARISTDVGGLLIGFVIPGHGHIVHDILEDLVIGPAMLTATGAVAEGLVEGYVSRRRNQVVERLRVGVQDMATSLYFNPLETLGEVAMAQAGSFGLDQALLERIPANLLLLHEATIGGSAEASA